MNIAENVSRFRTQKYILQILKNLKIPPFRKISIIFAVKVSDPEFECVAENVLETWQKDNHTFKKTEYTMKLDVNDRTFYSSGNTKKSAKTAAATEAWNVIRIGTM